MDVHGFLSLSQLLCAVCLTLLCTLCASSPTPLNTGITPHTTQVCFKSFTMDKQCRMTSKCGDNGNTNATVCPKAYVDPHVYWHVVLVGLLVPLLFPQC